jgi:hypothetical protein
MSVCLASPPATKSSNESCGSQIRFQKQVPRSRAVYGTKLVWTPLTGRYTEVKRALYLRSLALVWCVIALSRLNTCHLGLALRVPDFECPGFGYPSMFILIECIPTPRSFLATSINPAINPYIIRLFDRSHSITHSDAAIVPVFWRRNF